MNFWGGFGCENIDPRAILPQLDILTLFLPNAWTPWLVKKKGKIIFRFVEMNL